MMLANVLPRLGSLLSQRGVQAIAAGFLSGAVGGSALVATGLVPLGGTRLAPPTVALMACPGAGGTLARVTTGQSLLVTARSADGRWLDCPAYDRAALCPGHEIAGPALVTQADTTSWIPAGWVARVDGWYNMIVDYG